MRLILVPALISLAVTLLRLGGELNRWSSAFFNREAGGPLAVVGIVWLVPIFGVYFAWQLDKAGRGPTSRGRALSLVVAGIVVFVLFNLLIPRLPVSIVGRIVLFNVASALSALVAAWGWPELGKLELVYGLAARIPVALVALVAMANTWGTHYELGPPGFPEMGLIPKWLTIGLLPQLVFWIGFTVTVGLLFGSVAVLFRRRNY